MNIRPLVLAAIVLTLPALSAAQQLTDEASVPRMSLSEFKKAVDGGLVLVVDVRDAASYAGWHIPGAISIPLTDVEKAAPELKRAKKPIVTYCA